MFNKMVSNNKMFSKYFIIVSIICVCAKVECSTNPLEWLPRSFDPKDNPSLHLIKHGGKAYYVQSIFTATYFQAMQFCRYHGMRLLSITSESENTFLGKKISELDLQGHHFWTSGTISGINKWTWMSTGDPIIYTHWDIGEPSGGGNPPEECLEVRMKHGGLWWNDLECMAKLYFICDNPLSDT